MEEQTLAPRYLLPFSTRKLPHLFCDVLVCGTGAAGLRAAAAAREFGEVFLVTKADADDSNTARAQGGVASVLSTTDSFEEHLNDTLSAGDGLCDEAVVRAVIKEGPAELRLLESWGLRFDRENGELSLTREGGHSHRRVAHAGGDATGERISDTMLGHVRSLPGVSVFERTFAVDVLTERSDGSVQGVLVLDEDGSPRVIATRAVILAAGGMGRIYRETTNPQVATGDGLAMAYRAGALLRDLELVQFHPTSLYLPGASRFLITEAVRGEGGVLRDATGHQFMPDYHDMGDLAPRDVVSRSILAQMRKTESVCVFLDLRGVQSVDPRTRFPRIAAELDKYNIDVARDRVPVRPSAHYLIGGVACGLDGATNVPGLFVCGEAASTGLHGANRLGSNSLLEALVTGRCAGEAAGRLAREWAKPEPAGSPSKTAHHPRGADLNVEDVENSVRSLMWHNVGIVRSGSDLLEAVEKIAFWSGYVFPNSNSDRRSLELKNMLSLARLVARSALRREETRGVHCRSDFPKRDDANWRRHNDCEVLGKGNKATFQ